MGWQEQDLERSGGEEGMICFATLFATILLVGGIVGLCILGIWLLVRGWTPDSEAWYDKPFFGGEPDHVKAERLMVKLEDEKKEVAT